MINTAQAGTPAEFTEFSHIESSMGFLGELPADLPADIAAWATAPAFAPGSLPCIIRRAADGSMLAPLTVVGGADDGAVVAVRSIDLELNDEPAGHLRLRHAAALVLPGPADAPTVVASSLGAAVAVWGGTGCQTYGVVSARQLLRVGMALSPRRLVVIKQQHEPYSHAARVFWRVARLLRARAGHDVLVVDEPIQRTQDAFAHAVRTGAREVLRSLVWHADEVGQDDEALALRELGEAFRRADAAEPVPVDVPGHPVVHDLPPGVGRIVPAVIAAREEDPPGRLLPVDVASRRVIDLVRGWADDVVGWRSDLDKEGEPRFEPPHAGARVGVGIGKTDALVKSLPSHPAFRGRVTHVYAPTLELAAEIEGRYRSAVQADGLEDEAPASMTWRGREAAGCLRPPEVLRAVEAAGLPVMSTLCVRKTADGQITSKCPHYDQCPFIQQLEAARAMRDDPRGCVMALAHAYLPMPESAGPATPDLAVIDEGFWSTMTRDSRVPASLFVEAAPVPLRKRGEDADDDTAAADRDVDHAAIDLEATARLARAARALHDLVIEAAAGGGRKLDLPTLESIGLDERELRHLSRLEYRRLRRSDADPSMPDATIQAVLETSAAERRAITSRARVWRILADEMRRWAPADNTTPPRRQTLNGVRLDRARDGGLVLDLAWSSDIRSFDARTTPAIALDATGDRQLVRRWLPYLGDWEDLQAEAPHAHVQQIVDSSGSKRTWLPLKRSATAEIGAADPDAAPDAAAREADRQANRRADLRTIAGRMAAKHGGCLVLTYKDLEERMVADGLPTGVEVAHFGALRGIDRWRGVPSIVVAGRPFPRTADLDRATRAVYYAAPFALDAEGADGQLDAILLADKAGRRIHREVTLPKSPWHRRILAQICDAELIQALGRGRLARRTASNPCEVVVWSAVELADVAVDRLVRLRDLLPDALTTVAETVGVVPMSPADLGRVAPGIGSAEHALRVAGTGGPWLEALGPGAVRVEYRRTGTRGRWSVAWMRADLAADAEAVLRRVLSDATIVAGNGLSMHAHA